MAFSWLVNRGDPNYLQVLGWSSKQMGTKNLVLKELPTHIPLIHGLVTLSHQKGASSSWDIGSEGIDMEEPATIQDKNPWKTLSWSK